MNSFAIALFFVAVARTVGHSLDALLIGRALSWLCAAACSYAYNDLVDVPVDVVNRPNRPLPAQHVSQDAARVLIAILLLTTTATTLAFWPILRPWPLLGVAGGLIYSAFVRQRNALAANLLTATLTASVPLSAGGLSSTAIVLGVVILALIFARELQKDMVDAEGDRPYRDAPVLERLNESAGFFLYFGSIAAAIIGLTLSAVLFVGAIMWASTIPIAALMIARAVGRPKPQLESFLLKLTAFMIAPCLLAAAS